MTMEERTIAAGTFKAECLGLIDRVQQTAAYRDEARLTSGGGHSRA